MSRRVFVGVFEREEDIHGAVRAVRERGWNIVDIYTPYAVHGLERAAGFKPSRLPWVCFFFAVVGATFKVWFEFWTTTVSWPVNVAGKPWNSLPAFVPVTFEVMVLFAGVGTVIAFFLAVGLRPGKKAVLPHPRVTDDRFALLVEETDAAFNPAEARAICARFNAVHTEEREEGAQ
jgi:hypothetical protein